MQKKSSIVPATIEQGSTASDTFANTLTGGDLAKGAVGKFAQVSTDTLVELMKNVIVDVLIKAAVTKLSQISADSMTTVVKMANKGQLE